MTKPVRINIRRKTKVPTKNQIVHQWRSDWKLIGTITYEDSIKIFKNVGNGPVERDSQFAKLLYKNYGAGEYSLVAWNKGRKGFFSFWKVSLEPNGFARMPKNISSDEKDKKELMLEYRKLKKKLNDPSYKNDYHDIQEQISEIEVDIDFEKEMIDLEKSKTNGPSLYMKQSHPIYRKHSYENYGDNKNVGVVVNDFW